MGRPTTLVVEARYIRCADSDLAEVALVVADSWRRVGLGTSLARTLVRRACRAGVRRMWGDVLQENRATREFAHTHGARSVPGTGYAGIVRLCLEV
jgi:acetyltransferase